MCSSSVGWEAPELLPQPTPSINSCTLLCCYLKGVIQYSFFPRAYIILLHFLFDLCLYNSFHTHFFWHIVGVLCDLGFIIDCVMLSSAPQLSQWGVRFYKLSHRLAHVDTTHGDF